MLKAFGNIWTVIIIAFYRGILFNVKSFLSIVLDCRLIIPVLKAAAAMAKELTVTSTAMRSTITTRFHN